jgi:hypothetical protein
LGNDHLHASADDSGTLVSAAAIEAARGLGTDRRSRTALLRRADNRSHRVTIETDAPEILARCRA